MWTLPQSACQWHHTSNIYYVDVFSQTDAKKLERIYSYENLQNLQNCF